MAVTDILHAEDLGDAILTMISTYGPAAWYLEGHAEYLKLVDYGDCRYYSIREQQGDRTATIKAETPALLVRPITATHDSEFAGVGGQLATIDRFRIVMVRTTEQALDGSGDQTTIARAKARYLKEISKAVLGALRLDLPELTCADTSADVMRVDFVQADYSEQTPDCQAIYDLRNGCWAVALDVEVKVSTVG